MALILLIIIGAAGGWFASIIARTEAPGEILRQIGVGILSGLAVGVPVNSMTFLGGLTLVALGSAVAAIAAALVLYHAVLSRRAES